MLITLSAIAAWWLQRAWIEQQSNASLNLPVSELEDLPSLTITRTMRRTDFIHPVQDGVATTVDPSGRIWKREWWRDGVCRRTECFFYDSTGKLISHGGMRSGLAHGTWKSWSRHPENCAPRCWQFDEGVIIDATIVERDETTAMFTYGGYYQFGVNLRKLFLSLDELDKIIESQQPRDASLPLHVFEFEDGQLLSVDGRDATGFVPRLLKDAPLRELSDVIYPLRKGGRGWYQASDPRQLRKAIVHCPPLPKLASDYLIMNVQGLVYDYRFGRWVTVSREDATTWEDRTNVGHLRGWAFDAPSNGLRLYGYYPQRIGQIVASIESALNAVNDDEQFSIGFATMGLADRLSPEALSRGTLRNTLGQLLDNGGLACKQEGVHITIMEDSKVLNRP